MAITIITEPTDFGRVYDTNRLMYKFSSDNYTQPNFRFYIQVTLSDVDDVVFETKSIVRKRALPDGTCYFNPAEIFSNYFSSDLTININSLTEALNSNKICFITVFEEWGDPSELKTSIYETTNQNMLYNGLQEYVPYDIEEYGGGNNKWVMSGVTISQSTWIEHSSWANELDTFGDGEIKFNNAVVDGISNLTSIEISYTDNSSGDAKVFLNGISTDEYICFVDTLDVNNCFFIRYGSKVDTPTKTTWSDITYESKGSTMLDSGFIDGAKINIKYTEFDETRGQGQFLTDATDFRVDTYEYGNLYFIASKEDKPTHARIKVWYWSDGVEPEIGGGGGYETNKYVNNSGKIAKDVNISISASNPDSVSRGFKPPDPIEDPGEETGGDPVTPNFKYMISSYNTGYTLDYTNVDNQMFYIPTGPVELAKLGLFDLADSEGGWVSYRIDLTNDIKNPTKIYNKYPVYYYRKSKCNKYDPIQLFWLNPHGGYDSYTFNKKNYIEYDVKRTLWEHRFSDTYTLGERGTTVYKTKATKRSVLNTDYLSGTESQILSQLQQSPEVYAAYSYAGNIYKIPYIVEDTKYQYKELKNEKAIVMEIVISPAWSRVSQTS